MLIRFYLILINLAAFALFGLDKRYAKRHKWRIPEKTLLLAAVLGGAPGAMAGMYLFHHKTRKWPFSIGIPLILVLQVIAGIWLLQQIAVLP